MAAHRVFLSHTGLLARLPDEEHSYVQSALEGVIDAWHVQPATNYFVDLRLSPGNHSLRVEYYEEGGSASVRLTWQQWQRGE